MFKCLDYVNREQVGCTQQMYRLDTSIICKTI